MDWVWKDLRLNLSADGDQVILICGTYVRLKRDFLKLSHRWRHSSVCSGTHTVGISGARPTWSISFEKEEGGGRKTSVELGRGSRSLTQEGMRTR